MELFGASCLFNIHYRSDTFPHFLNITIIVIEITIIIVFLGLSNFSINSISKQIIVFGNVCIQFDSIQMNNNMQKIRYYMSRGLPKAYKCSTNKTGRPYIR